ARETSEADVLERPQEGARQALTRGPLVAPEAARQPPARVERDEGRRVRSSGRHLRPSAEAPLPGEQLADDLRRPGVLRLAERAAQRSPGERFYDAPRRRTRHACEAPRPSASSAGTISSSMIL